MVVGGRTFLLALLLDAPVVERSARSMATCNRSSDVENLNLNVEGRTKWSGRRRGAMLNCYSLFKPRPCILSRRSTVSIALSFLGSDYYRISSPSRSPPLEAVSRQIIFVSEWQSSFCHWAHLMCVQRLMFITPVFAISSCAVVVEHPTTIFEEGRGGN